MHKPSAPHRGGGGEKIYIYIYRERERERERESILYLYLSIFIKEIAEWSEDDAKSCSRVTGARLKAESPGMKPHDFVEDEWREAGFSSQLH